MLFGRTLRTPLLGGTAMVLGLTLTACGDAGPGEPLGRSESEVVTPFTAFANDQSAFDYFVGQGLTNFQAAGIVGNLNQESGVNPDSVQQGGPGRGIAQWSAGGRWDTSSNDNVLWYATKEGELSSSLTLQLQFIWYELTTFSSYGLAALRATTNVTDATIAFETDFEGCGTCNQSTRIAYAESVLSAYGAVAYAAQFVSQSFPLASTTLTMTEGQVIPSYIELKNVGTKAWDSNTRIGTTEPRDRASVFADKTWVAPDRLAAVTGTVAPGATYKFTFNLAAPLTTGAYTEYFGVVEDGVAWFGDPGQGGPPDNQLEVKIDVVEPEGGVPHEDAGASEPDGAAADGASREDAGHNGKPGGDTDAGSSSPDPGDVDGGSSDEGGVSAGDDTPGRSSGGCSVASTRGDAPAMGLWILVGLGLAAARRRVAGVRPR